MMFALIFVLNRISQILTLIPTMGMMAWFVHQYQSQNALTPDPILILFITSVLALAWALFTLFSYHRSSANAHFVCAIDAGFFGAFIAAVYYLRGIASADCTSVTDDTWTAHIGGFTISGPGVQWSTDKPCAMLKASWAFAIMNIIFFAITAVVAFFHGGHIGRHEETRYHSRSRSPSHHHHRHGHRHRSHSGSYEERRSTRRVYV